jgi:TonB family protein
MAHQPIWRPDSAKSPRPDSVGSEATPEEVSLPADLSGVENSAAQLGSDFAEVASKFATHGRGQIPPDLSGELALDIVLNEIVEQACLATGATGAAIALARDGEMVCRASTGGNAPELGTPLDMNSGLSGACLRSREIQRCDDALTHPNVDPEVSRQLGIRSVVVLPLLRGEDSIGIFEVFSSRPAAFGERDLRTLEVLKDRILKNIQARKSSLDALELAPTSVGEMLHESSETEIEEPTEAGLETADNPAQTPEAMQPELEQTEAPVSVSSRFDWLTALLSGVIIAIALLMGTVFGIRMGWLKASVQHRSLKPRAAATPSITTGMSSAGNPRNASARETESKIIANEPNKSANTPRRAQTETGQAAEGSLRVYENGKEIFRMPPSEIDAAAAPSAEKNAKSNSALSPASIVELSPEAAEGSLIHRVEPEYPEQALAQHIQGPVLLDVRIGRQGTVEQIKVVSGDPQLAEAATAAVQQWKFKPQLVNGHAAEMETQITLKFTLPSS